MNQNKKIPREFKAINLFSFFIKWSIVIFIAKLVVLANIPGGFWNAADGDNYIKGVEALINDGIFAKEINLTYWPAGYPLFIYSLCIFGISWVLTTTVILQSFIFSFAVYFFAKQLSLTRLSKYTKLVFLIILLNPTLSLSSLSIGYESLAASGSLLATGLIIQDLIYKNDSKFFRNLMAVSGIFSFLIFIQPRLAVASLIVIFVWVLKRKFKKASVLFMTASLAVLFLLPTGLILRNEKAVGIRSISTNLGSTMNIGAGNGATGGYDSKIKGVKCLIKPTDINSEEIAKILCILKWYLNNPDKSLNLFLNKTVYFWSPWSGPILSGTMGLNPWLKINPIKSIEKTPGGSEFLLSAFGKTIAWIWLLGGLFFLFYGFFTLWKLNFLERFIGVLALIIVLSSWVVTLFSIGDHRFRLPVMGMSLFLQAIGIKTLFKGGKVVMVDGPSLR